MHPAVSLLALEPDGHDAFIAANPQQHGRLFGGLVAAQAVMAAGLTTGGSPLHSLHAYFLRPGRPALPIRYEVARLKDGRNFSARQVVARQRDEVLFSLMASFAAPEEGISHQRPRPVAPTPESGIARALGWFGPAWLSDSPPFELRLCDELDRDEPRRFTWFRVNTPLPDDPLLHTALVTLFSDFTLMSTGALRHGISREERRGASLDHAMWFHHVPRVVGWMLHAMESPAAHSSRALNLGVIYGADGTHVASVAQEGLIRRARPSPAQL